MYTSPNNIIICSWLGKVPTSPLTLSHKCHVTFNSYRSLISLKVIL